MTKNNRDLRTNHILENIFGDRIRTTISENLHIVRCSSCDGTGWTSDEELSDYHKREYSIINDKCAECGGCGRQVETIQSVTVYPDLKIKSQSFVNKTRVPWTENPIKEPHVNVFYTQKSFLF